MKETFPIFAPDVGLELLSADVRGVPKYCPAASESGEISWPKFLLLVDGSSSTSGEK
jgi:hypothetical protein